MDDETSYGGAAGDTDAIVECEKEDELDDEARYAAAAAGDPVAIVEWEKLLDLEFNHIYVAIYHTVTNYKEHRNFITEKLANRKLLFKVNGDEETALHLVAKKGHEDVFWVLIEAARKLKSPSDNDIHSSHQTSFLDDFVWHPNRYKDTALHLALRNGYDEIAYHLAQTSPPRHGHDIKNHLGETPIYLAVKLGNSFLVGTMCDAWKFYLPLDGPDGCSATLHAAILKFPMEKGNSDVVASLIKSRAKDMRKLYSGCEAIFDKTDKNYDTVLSLSVRELQVRAAEAILEEDPAYKNGRVRKINDLKSLISLAAEKTEKESKYMTNLLTRNYQARKHIGHAGQSVLHTAIIERDEESVLKLLRDDADLLSKADSEYWTPLHYAAYYDFYSILDATHVGYKAEEYESANLTWWIPTPLHVAAKEGHTSTLIKLMELLPASLYVAVDSLTRQNILHLAVLASRKEMILHILEKCQDHIDQILNQQDVNGDTPLHLLIRDGCFVPELIKHKKVDRTTKNKLHWTSFDMLYFKDQIVADQVKIKKALDDFQTDQHWKFWQLFMFWRRIEKKSILAESLVPPSKRTTKDNEFIKAKKLLMKENLIQMKDELDRYRQRTNTQIIVTALITTVTFTVGFTMPGGLHQDGEQEGMVILSKKKAFIAFMVSDAIALLLSTSSLFLYFIASMYEDPHNVSRLNDASTVLNIVSVIAMMLTFITGTYLVLSHSQALAITVCVISCFFFFLVIIGLLIKWRYDRKQEKLHEV